tara:strand:- start:218 stop:958 length:741 start_codon:yes stop_codon:yes gene_type:complete
MSQKKKKLDTLFKRVKSLYKKLPETRGCLKHIDLPIDSGGCGGRCCELQQPQVLHIEFLYAWRNVISNWKLEEILNLIQAALRSYLSERTTKPCVFWDSETKLCKHHETRPLSCRQYAITPEEEFRPRYERLKILYQDDPTAVFMDQCNLVSTVNGKKVTRRDTSAWWDKLTKIEEDNGVSKKMIHDQPGGSYRTYPEHILIHVFSESVISQLQTLKQFGEPAEREYVACSLMNAAKSKLEKLNAN